MFGATLIAHAAFPAPVVFTSEGLFVAGMSAVFGAYWVAHHREGTPGRVAGVGLGLAAAGCFSVATVLPFLIGPGSLSDDPRRSEPGSHPSVPRRLIVAMTGLQTSLSVSPGRHTLRAEFVASDHGPFRPPVLTEVTFEVQPRRGAA
ncbi:MAG: hypothetical protein E6F95_04695 [Actinobacteria bacterium]|nr:MAG: hypothetical protein E6F95_04695 [Actinomycetota bacterium]